jgi:hypothetical protein
VAMWKSASAWGMKLVAARRNRRVMKSMIVVKVGVKNTHSEKRIKRRKDFAECKIELGPEHGLIENAGDLYSRYSTLLRACTTILLSSSKTEWSAYELFRDPSLVIDRS